MFRIIFVLEGIIYIVVHVCSICLARRNGKFACRPTMDWCEIFCPEALLKQFASESRKAKIGPQPRPNKLRSNERLCNWVSRLIQPANKTRHNPDPYNNLRARRTPKTRLAEQSQESQSRWTLSQANPKSFLDMICIYWIHYLNVCMFTLSVSGFTPISHSQTHIHAKKQSFSKVQRLSGSCGGWKTHRMLEWICPSTLQKRTHEHFRIKRFYCVTSSSPLCDFVTNKLRNEAILRGVQPKSQRFDLSCGRKYTGSHTSGLHKKTNSL